MNQARVFFAWTPLQLLMSAAAASSVPANEASRVLIWIGSPNTPWQAMRPTVPIWDQMLDWSEWGLLGFRTWVANRHRVSQAIAEAMTTTFADKDIIEVGVASEDEYLSLAFIRAVMKRTGRPFSTLVSLFEDGLALYLRTRHPSPTRHFAKVLLSGALGEMALLPGRGYLARNPAIRKIYATHPDSLPKTTGKTIVDIGDEFRSLVLACASANDLIPRLPPRSAMILSENLSPNVLSQSAERELNVRMVDILRSECGAEHVFIKYHHFDTPEKRQQFDALDVRELELPRLPYEIFHSSLRPSHLAAAVSSALLYCRAGSETECLAFCSGRHRLPTAADFFRDHGIRVM